jgi:hypothetical protein
MGPEGKKGGGRDAAQPARLSGEEARPIPICARHATSACKPCRTNSGASKASNSINDAETLPCTQRGNSYFERNILLRIASTWTRITTNDASVTPGLF